MTTGSSVITTLRYRDAKKAIEWLCAAFGFVAHMVVENDDGTIGHAQLTFGETGMIMLGSAGKGDFDNVVKPPSSDGTNTHSAYVIIDDVDDHCERAKAAGAEILSPPEDQDYGGRLYTCRDPEGYIWSFGSYDPWDGA